MEKVREHLKKIFWALPIPLWLKVKFRNIFPQNKDFVIETKEALSLNSEDYRLLSDYCETILSIPNRRNSQYVEFKNHSNQKARKALLCAYYLTQYHPTVKNNLWWGKGTTEWTNVTKAVPQYPGHYQPRLPGELGFYDLRLPENMYRQIELARNYGIDAFSFYYYWFNGERALEAPLNMFLEHVDMDIAFCLCWCNEDWTKRYNGTSSEVLLSINKTENGYLRFIEDVIPIFLDNRYIKIDNKYVLIVYRPSEIPNCKVTISKWREIVNNATGHDLYLIASQEANIFENWLKYGFDAISQFQPASSMSFAKDITDSFHPIRSDFDGHIYDYKHIANTAIEKLSGISKIYPAVMPMWDNTSRRNHRGLIYEGSSPHIYKKWLDSAIKYVENNNQLEEKMILINAWNEWGEGAYLEPDREYGYAYLESTFQSNYLCEDQLEDSHGIIS